MHALPKSFRKKLKVSPDVSSTVTISAAYELAETERARPKPAMVAREPHRSATLRSNSARSAASSSSSRAGGCVLVTAPHLLQESAQDRVRVEVRFGDRAGRGGVARVVGFDGANRRGRLFERAEGQQTLAHRQHRAKTGVLYHHRPASGQVARRAFTEPAGSILDIALLGHTPLGE